MQKKERPLDRKSPDWIGIGIMVLILAVLGWLSVDAFYKARAGRDLKDAIQAENFVEVRRLLTKRRMNSAEVNNGLVQMVGQHAKHTQTQEELDLATLLMEHGADPEQSATTDYSGQTAFLLAIRLHDKPMLARLFKQHPKFNDSMNANSYLVETTIGSNPEILQLLIDHGALKQVQAQKEGGQNLLRIAIMRNSDVVTKMLLEHGVSPEIKINDDPALCTALSMHFWKTARELIVHGARVNVVGAKHRTPLSIATQLKNKEMIDLLKAHGAVDKKSTNGKVKIDGIK